MVADLDVEHIHVSAPTAIVFLCGGPCSDIASGKILSLRDAFLKIIDNPALRKRTLLMAEDIQAFDVLLSNYADWLTFETDLAQIVDLILLFSESEGSLAELGAFSMLEDIASRLLVVVRERYWSSRSFIKLGPLTALQKRWGNNSVYVVDDDDLGIKDNSYAAVDKNRLCERLQDILEFHFDKNKDSTTISKTRSGHLIKLIVGLVQDYGALTLEEISEALIQLDISISNERLLQLLGCAQAVDWVVVKRKGVNTFYVAKT